MAKLNIEFKNGKIKKTLTIRNEKYELTETENFLVQVKKNHPEWISISSAVSYALEALTSDNKEKIQEALDIIDDCISPTMINKENLDKRICDCEECSNTQTYREFIRKSEDYFKIEHLDLESLREGELIEYFDFLDGLYGK